MNKVKNSSWNNLSLSPKVIYTSKRLNAWFILTKAIGFPISWHWSQHFFRERKQCIVFIKLMWQESIAIMHILLRLTSSHTGAKKMLFPVLKITFHFVKAYFNKQFHPTIQPWWPICWHGYKGTFTHKWPFTAGPAQPQMAQGAVLRDSPNDVGLREWEFTGLTVHWAILANWSGSLLLMSPLDLHSNHDSGSVLYYPVCLQVLSPWQQLSEPTSTLAAGD